MLDFAMQGIFRWNVPNSSQHQAGASFLMLEKVGLEARGEKKEKDKG